MSRIRQGMCILIAACVVVSGMAACVAPAAHAAAGDGSLNLVTSPLPISLVAKPGTTTSADIRVKNGGVAAEQLKVGLLKFGAYGEDGKPKLLNFEAGDEYKNWVHFSQNVFTAQPNVWNTIHMTITLPKTAAFGYYYAVTFSRATPDVAATSETLAGATAVLVLLEAQVPNAQRSVQVLDFESNKRIYEFLPTKFTVRLRNNGNVHVAPRGNIFISKKGNDTISTLNVNQAQGFILPQSNRTFDASWMDGFPVYKEIIENGKVVEKSNSDPEMKLTWNLGQASKFRFGKYRADLTLAYDDGHGHDVPIEATVSFWVIPWRIIGAFVIFFMILGLGVWGVVRGFRRR